MQYVHISTLFLPDPSEIHRMYTESLPSTAMAIDSSKSFSEYHTEVERLPPQNVLHEADIHDFDEKEGYVVDLGGADRADLKLAKDGHTILVPQPSDDPRDPLNWPRYKKGLFLGIWACIALLPEYCAATGAAALFPQAM